MEQCKREDWYFKNPCAGPGICTWTDCYEVKTYRAKYNIPCECYHCQRLRENLAELEHSKTC